MLSPSSEIESILCRPQLRLLLPDIDEMVSASSFNNTLSTWSELNLSLSILKRRLCLSALSLSTFEDAFHFRKPENLIFHSDQGVQYTAYVFRQRLRDLQVKQSFSTPGNPYDNSVCESFFHTLKKEALYHHLYETPQELEEVLDEYIDFYNGYRPHRKLNMKTPIQYETEFFSAACS